MAENATTSGSAARARTGESKESADRENAKSVENDASAAVAESLAQLEPKPRKAPAVVIEDVATTLDAIVDGVRSGSEGGKTAKEPRKRVSKKASEASKPSTADADERSKGETGGADAGTKKKEGVRAKAKADSGKKAGTRADGSDSAREAAGGDPQFSSAEGTASVEIPAVGMTALLFQEPDASRVRTRRRRSEGAASSARVRARSRRSSSEEAESSQDVGEDAAASEEETSSEPRRRRRGSRGRRKSGEAATAARARSEESESAAPANPEKGGEETSTRRRRRRARSTEASAADEVAAPKGSTRLEAKRQRRREGREAGRRRHVITESEYLARRESVKREMLIREQDGLNQIAVLEDDVLVEHYVARHTQVSMVGNVYLGRVQNVLPSMEAAFVDIGKGRNAVLYAGEVNWEAAGMEGKPRRIEQALKSGDVILVQVTKDPIGHKGARLTAQITLAGRHLVLVPSGAMTGISRKLPDKERQRLKRLLRELIPARHGVIVRTAAEGATEEQLRADVERLTKTWEDIQAKAKNVKSAPTLLKGEPELAVRVVRDIFNEDFLSLKIQGAEAWKTISSYVGELSPELTGRLEHWTDATDIFVEYRVDEQLAKAFDRKVWLPSGGTLIIDRTEAMTVVDVNTGKFTGAGGTLEETVTRNNLEAAEEIVRQLRLRDIGGIIVVDFIDMVLEANRELVLRRLVECLGRDRTRHQVAEVTSLGLVQMTRKRVGQGLVEAFSTACEVCDGRGFITHTHPVERNEPASRPNRKKAEARTEETKRDEVRAALSSIAAAAASKHDDSHPQEDEGSPEETAKASGKSGAAGTRTSTRSRAKTRKTSSGAAERADADSQPDEGGKAAAKAGATGEVEGSGSAPSAGGASKGSEAEGAADAAEEAKTRRHRVSSSGTITPGAGSASAILTFPAK